MNLLLKRTQIINVVNINSLLANQHYSIVTFDDGYQNILENAIPELLIRKIPAVIFITSGSIGEKPSWIPNNSHSFKNEYILTEEQIKNLDKMLITIGSHCDTHPDLTKLTNDQIINEFLVSKHVLEKITKRKITMISFPHGRYNDSIIKFAKEVGYQRAFSIDPELITENNNKFIYGRINVEPTDWSIEYFLKIYGAYSWLNNIYKWKKKLISIIDKKNS